MSPQLVDIFFQIVVLLFALSVHESAHAWMAWRRGDPTAYMMGRVTLNPIKHIDPIGTILLPIIAVFARIPMIGWARPTPVSTRNFKKPVLDDILTTVAGPLSNLLIAAGAMLCFFLIAQLVPQGRDMINVAINAHFGHANAFTVSSIFMPICVFLYWTLFLNLLLAIFNLIPIPPLDGSHVIRHFLPSSILRAYDMIGVLGIILLIVVGRPILEFFFNPVLAVFHFILASF
jgi:Zn-dependent protease